jgi:hypothetical protein
MHPESTGGVNRRALLQMVAGTATGAAVIGGIPAVAAAQKGLRAQMEMSKERRMSQPRGGQLYMQSAPNAFEGAASVILTAAVTHLSAFAFCRERVR